MTTIANIDINLRATTESLDGDLTKGKKKVKDAVEELSSIQKVGKVVSPLSSMFDVKSVPVIGQAVSAFGEASSAAGAFSVAGVAAGAAVAGAVAAVAAAAMATSYAIGKINEQMEEIDRMSDKAKSFGLAPAELNTLEKSLGETSGLDTAAIDSSIQKLQLNLAEAASTGKGAAADALSKLGLDATELIKQGPMEAIMSISEAMQQLENPTEQLAASFDLFGKSGAMLVNSLREGPDAIEDMNQFLDGFGLNVSEQQAEQVGAANDAWGRIEMIATGVWRQIAAESAPVMAAIYDAILEAADGFAGWYEVLPFFVDNIVLFSGGLYDASEIAMLTYNTLHRIATLDFSGAIQGVKDAADFGTGQKWLDRVNEQRRRASEAIKPFTHEGDLTGFEQNREAAKEAAKKAEENHKAEAKLIEERKKVADAEAKALRDKRDNIVEENRILLEQLKQMQAGVKVVDTKSIKEFFDIGLDHIKGPFRDSVLAAQAQRRELEKAIKDMERAREIREELQTPLQKLTQSIEEIARLNVNGLLSDKDAESKAMRLAKDDLPGLAGAKGVSTVVAGTAEAYKKSLELRGKSEEEKEKRKVMQEILKTQKDLLREAKKEPTTRLAVVGPN